MFDGNSTDESNPFAFAAQSAGRPRAQRLLSAFKFLLIVVVALSLMVALGHQSRRWLIHRITRDFSTLGEAEKQLRLSQLNDLGTSAMEAVLGVICDEDDSVARTAYEMLRTQQNDWRLLEHGAAIKNHLQLVQAMDVIVHQISDDRTSWTTGLLQQSISFSVNRQDEASARLYASATAMLDRMMLSDRAGPSILVNDASEYDQPRRWMVRTEPLPVPPSESTEDWTQWPPIETAPAIVYRSSAGGLQPLAPEDEVVLSHVDAVEPEVRIVERTVVPEPVSTKLPDEASDVRPAAMLVQSPLQTYDTQSVIYWLGNSHEPLRAAAKAELVSRGLSPDEIAIATRIAAGDVQTKLDLVDFVARSGSMDPRPWLLLLMKDPSRDVKLKAVAVLATIKDPAVEHEMRKHILDEPDPTVAFRIRRLLDLR